MERPMPPPSTRAWPPPLPPPKSTQQAGVAPTPGWSGLCLRHPHAPGRPDNPPPQPSKPATQQAGVAPTPETRILRHPSSLGARTPTHPGGRRAPRGGRRLVRAGPPVTRPAATRRGSPVRHAACACSCVSCARVRASTCARAHVDACVLPFVH
eukprot:365973-Chlamydomonas_euryale.AAC.22